MSKASFRSSRPEVLPQEGAPKRRSKPTEAHSCGSVIPTVLLCNSVEITLPHGHSPTNLLHPPKIPHYKNTSVGLPLCFFLSQTDYSIRIIQQILSYARNFYKLYIESFRFPYSNFVFENVQ